MPGPVTVMLVGLLLLLLLDSGRTRAGSVHARRWPVCLRVCGGVVHRLLVRAAWHREKRSGRV